MPVIMVKKPAQAETTKAGETMGLFGGTPNSLCTVAQAMSALVKSIRLRHAESAVYWYYHVATCFPDQKYRLFRRFLIIGAEDCINPEVQRQVHEWYKLAYSSAKVHELAAYLIHRICATENWWASESGQRYIAAWRKQEKRHGQFDKNATEEEIEWLKNNGVKHIVDNAVNALAARRAGHYAEAAQFTDEALSTHFRGCAVGINRNQYSEALVEAAANAGELQARMTAQTHLSYKKDLSPMDENWLGQAVWRLCGMELDGKLLHEVRDEEVSASINNALKELYSKPRTPPEWTQDGIHCKGKDRRFAGLLKMMLACCNAFNRDGKLTPVVTFDEACYEITTLESFYGSAFPY